MKRRHTCPRAKYALELVLQLLSAHLPVELKSVVVALHSSDAGNACPYEYILRSRQRFIRRFHALAALRQWLLLVHRSYNNIPLSWSHALQYCQCQLRWGAHRLEAHPQVGQWSSDSGWQLRYLLVLSGLFLSGSLSIGSSGMLTSWSAISAPFDENVCAYCHTRVLLGLITPRPTFKNVSAAPLVRRSPLGIEEALHFHNSTAAALKWTRKRELLLVWILNTRYPLPQSSSHRPTLSAIALFLLPCNTDQAVSNEKRTVTIFWSHLM